MVNTKRKDGIKCFFLLSDKAIDNDLMLFPFERIASVSSSSSSFVEADNDIKTPILKSSQFVSDKRS